MSQDLASLVDKEVLYQEAKAELTVARAATVACLACAVMAVVGPHSAQISGAEGLPPIQDVVLSLDLPGQGPCTVYAKVWAERGETTLRFTSVTSEDRQKLERV